ncbi:hypothetical protein [Geothrix sp. PMB-07]|uniref:hypothetical protein n=1 Tax=Geothrix sp. PMB-07 TaxID=3068640 RepID=UPI002740994E|nr:hypothetical protein [Geothrix sp. PMB-07]WLT31242.1 hypothetical protein Q9293_16115 [Geothrix sp. PMB-07]
MSNRTCEAVQRSLSERDGDIPPELRDHLQHCRECAQMQSLMGRLRKTDMHPEPSDADFLALRRGVLRDIRRHQDRKPGLFKRLAASFRRPAFALSGSGLLAVAGFLAGRHSGHPATVAPTSWSSSEDAMVREIQLAALQNRGRRDVDQATYRYENVWMEDRADGQVALRFDVTRQVALALPRNNALVSDVLAQVLASTSPVGEKLRAIDCAGTTLEPAVRRGLIQVMLTDANLGVRLKAQAKLIEQNGDPEIQEALLRVLQNEVSVQMRLVAIDHLTRHRINPDVLRQALAPAARPDAVHLKAMTYLNEQGGTL